MEDNVTFNDVFDGTDDLGGGWEFIDQDEYIVPNPLEDDEFNNNPVTEEEEEETDEAIHTVKPNQDTEEEDDEPLPAYIAKTWASKGLLTIPEGLNIETDEDLDLAIEATIQQGIDRYKASITNPTAARFLDFLEKGGNPSDFINSTTENSFSYEADSEDEKIEVIRQMYADQKFSSNKSKILIDALIDSDGIDDEYAEAANYFKGKKEKAEQDLLENQARQREEEARVAEARNSAIKTLIEKSGEIRGFPLSSKKHKDELMSYIFDRNQVYVDPTGNKYQVTGYQKDKMQRNADPEAMYEDLLFDALVTRQGINPIQKSGVSQHSQKLKEKIEQYKQKSTASKLTTQGGKRGKDGTNKSITFEDWQDLD